MSSNSEELIKERVSDFEELLKQINTTTDKKKKLWLEIYENAVSDRQNAYHMYIMLLKIVQDKSTEHAVHGKSIATYIEKMSKANDQLIKLAELIAREEEKDETNNPDSIYDRISGQ